MTDTKPRLASGTIRATLTLILITVWKPLVMMLGALALAFGFEIDTAAWIPYADDSVITTMEWLAILRDVLVPLLAWAAYLFRVKATQVLSGWIKAKS